MAFSPMLRAVWPKLALPPFQCSRTTDPLTVCQLKRSSAVRTSAAGPVVRVPSAELTRNW